MYFLLFESYIPFTENQQYIFMTKEISCVICQKPASYRCPKCRRSPGTYYCSAACNKHHTQELHTNDAEITKRIRSGDCDEAEDSEPKTDSCSNVPPIPGETVGDPGLTVLQQRHLDALCGDAYRGVETSIRDQLKCKDLQKLIVPIDGSRSRLDALAAAQHNIPEFNRFCQQVLRTIYSVE